MTYEDLLDRVIADGIAEVRAAYAAPEEHHKRDGAIAGFEACRGKAPGELAGLWREAEADATQLMRRQHADASSDAREYWRQRYKALQIEWVCNVISVGLVNGGHSPLLSHLPTLRGGQKYVAIVGVHRGMETWS